MFDCLLQPCGPDVAPSALQREAFYITGSAAMSYKPLPFALYDRCPGGGGPQRGPTGGAVGARSRSCTCCRETIPLYIVNQWRCSPRQSIAPFAGQNQGPHGDHTGSRWQARQLSRQAGGPRDVGRPALASDGPDPAAHSVAIPRPLELLLHLRRLHMGGMDGAMEGFT